MIKPIKQWLLELPEPYQSRALSYKPIGNANSLYNALTLGFSWIFSNEGVEYWRNVANGLTAKPEVIVKNRKRKAKRINEYERRTNNHIKRHRRKSYSAL